MPFEINSSFMDLSLTILIALLVGLAIALLYIKTNILLTLNCAIVKAAKVPKMKSLKHSKAKKKA